MKTFVKLIVILAAYIFLCGLFYLFGAFYSLSFSPAKWPEGCRFAVIYIWFVITILAGGIGSYHLDKK